MVNSISKTVQNIIDADLSLQDVLQRDYGNYSAIARMLMPKIEEAVNQNVNIESIITSVKRAKTNYIILHGKITEIVAGSGLNIRTDMAKVSIEKNRENLGKVRKTLVSFSGDFLQVIEGNSVVTLISDLKSFFPPQRDFACLGIMLKLGWGGATSIVKADLGVFIEIGGPLRVVLAGIAHAELPKEDSALIQLNFQVLGIWDTENKSLFIDASLQGKLLFLSLDGNIIVRIIANLGSHAEDRSQ